MSRCSCPPCCETTLGSKVQWHLLSHVKLIGVWMSVPPTFYPTREKTAIIPRYYQLSSTRQSFKLLFNIWTRTFSTQTYVWQCIVIGSARHQTSRKRWSRYPTARVKHTSYTSSAIRPRKEKRKRLVIHLPAITRTTLYPTTTLTVFFLSNSLVDMGVYFW